jgi:hypothetical protein
MIVIDASGPLGSLTVRKNWARHFELACLSCKEDCVVLRALPASLFRKAFAHGSDCVERDKSLIVENRADPVGDLAMHLLALGCRLYRTGQ